MNKRRIKPFLLIALLTMVAMACARAAAPAPTPVAPSAAQPAAPTPAPAAKMYNTVIAPSSRTLKSIIYLKQNREDVVKYLMKELDLDDKIARASYEDVVKTVSPDGGVSDRGLDPWVDLGRISGAIKGEVNISKGVDFTLLKEMQKELGLSK